MNILYLLIAVIIGYVCGAIPFGFLYVKLFKKVDIRTIGSGRTGGTNSLRAAGPIVGFMTGLSDVAKGFLAIWLLRTLLGNALGELLPWAILAAGTASVIGHNWSIFIGWGGGAGTGPNVGWATAVWWPMLPIAFTVVIGMLLVIGMASVASLAMAFIIPIAFAILYFTGLDSTLSIASSPAYMIAGLLTAFAVAWALRPNIKRLIAGSERVVGPRARRVKQRRHSPTNERPNARLQE